MTKRIQWYKEMYPTLIKIERIYDVKISNVTTRFLGDLLPDRKGEQWETPKEVWSIRFYRLSDMKEQGLPAIFVDHGDTKIQGIYDVFQVGIEIGIQQSPVVQINYERIGDKTNLTVVLYL